MKLKKVLIVLVIAALVYYYWYTQHKECGCDCEDKNDCQCKKNPLEKLFDKINQKAGIKRAKCKSSIPESKKADATLTDDPTVDNANDLIQAGAPLADNVLNDAQEKTGEEIDFALQAEGVATEEKQRIEGAKRIKGLIGKLSGKMENEANLYRSVDDEGRWSDNEKAYIKQKTADEVKKLQMQITVLEGLRKNVLDTGDYEASAYGVYVMKGVIYPENANLIYKNLLDKQNYGNDYVIVCKKNDLANIAASVPCKNIVDLYWQNFVFTPSNY